MTEPHRPVTIVTGGSRGIGAAIVAELARAGHDLVVAYHSDGDAALRTLGAAEGAGARCTRFQADVRSPGDVDKLFDAAEAAFGTITGLVNNAGVTAHIANLADTPIEAIRRVIEVDFLGAVLCAREASRRMSRGRGGQGGVIVNISSAAATLGSAHEYVHYAAAKAAVDTLTMGLAKELAQEGVRVNAVAPGLVRTGIHAAAGDPGRVERAATRVPLGRPGEPHEIAKAVAWLFSTEASYVTGTVLRVAGGL